MSEKTAPDESSYQAVYDKAMKRLGKQAPWWTHREVSDPGITLIETWALLSDMQSYYMDQIQENHYRKYLKLLGIESDEGECASVWIFFDNVDRKRMVPEGTKLLAGDMVFETNDKINLTPNSIIGFYYQGSDTDRIKAMEINRKTKFYLKGKELFTIVLKDIVEKGEEIVFFVLLDETEKRNPAPEDFRMAELAWEYETINGWKEAQTVWDETNALLYSGRICLRIDDIMKKNICKENKYKDGYKIRCRIKSDDYDTYPVLYKLCLNVGRAVQKDTLLCEEQFVLTEDSHHVEMQSYLGRTGELKIFVSKGNELWEDITDCCDIDPPVTNSDSQRFIYFNKENMKSGKLKVVCGVPGTESEYGPCDITGVSSQRINLPWEHFVKKNIKFMLRQGTGERLFREYIQKAPEEYRYENVWHWDENTIVLGDGRHGEIPKNSENGLFMTSVSLWSGERGNVAIGKINQWERPELFMPVTLNNPLVGVGGRDALKPSEQFKSMTEILTHENRMVTKEDIRKLAVKTPGLMIRKAEAEFREGVIVVKIFSQNTLWNECVRNKYMAETEKYLEQYRPAACGLKVEIA